MDTGTTERNVSGKVSGSVTTNVVPWPGWLRKVSCPWCSRVRPSESARPIPEPEPPGACPW